MLTELETAAAPPATPLAVTFHLAGQRYALPLEAVLQVVRLPDLVQIAGAPPAVCGLLNLHGAFVPVLDGRLLVGAPTLAQLESSVIIVARGGRPSYGLLVDQVEAVRDFPRDGFAPVGEGAAFVAGVLREREEVAVLFDPQALGAQTAPGRDS